MTQSGPSQGTITILNTAFTTAPCRPKPKTLTDAARMLPVEKRDPVSAAHRRHAATTRSWSLVRKDQLKALPMSWLPIGWTLAWPPSLSRMLLEVILGMAAAELPWRDVSR